MILFLIILYVIVGAASAFGYKYLSYLWDVHLDEDAGTVVAILSGVLWPLIAPFAFAIIIAQHYAELKEYNKR